MKRPQKTLIQKDLKQKMVFLVGPRQVGKTWLAKEIARDYKNAIYLNYDSIPDREFMRKFAWLPETDLIVFDELHKMPKWKNYLKGVYDTKLPHQHILVTGSARLETYRKTGDSLAGRFFVHHLLPLSLAELEDSKQHGNLDRLIERGGFPEPFLATSATNAKRWRVGYVDSLLREDILEFADIEKHKSMREVFEIARTKVGSPLSYQNIAADVGISPVTVKRYIEIFKALYIVFTISPYTKKISRSTLKEQKLYFYDTGLVNSDEGVVFENVIANALLKQVYLKKDREAFGGYLFYLKNKDKKEVDFLLTGDTGTPEKMIEVKLSDNKPTDGLKYFSAKYEIKGVQVLKNLARGERYGNLIEIREVKDFLKKLV